MKLRNKTLIFLIPLIVIPMTLIGAVAFFKLKNLTEHQLSTQAVTLVEQISGYVDNKVSTAEANLLLLADHQLVKQYAVAIDDTVRYELLLPHLLDVFNKLQKSVPHYYEIKFILPNGYEDAVWLEANLENKHESIRNEVFFDEMSNSTLPVYTRLIYDENTNKHAIFLAKKIIVNSPAVDAVNKPAKLRGYLAITLSLDHIREQVNRNSIGNFGFLAALNNVGQIMHIPDSSKQYSDDLISLFQSNIASDFSQPSFIKLQHKDETFRIYQGKLPANMILIGALAEKEITNNSIALGKIIISISLIAIFVAIFFAFITLRSIILRPIDLLTSAAISIGQGKHTPDIDIKREDEIGDLAKTFIEMSNNLNQMHREVNYTANHDGLTGLPNRSMFTAYLKKILTIAEQKQQKVALLFIDLDDFKSVNDTLGHKAGDLLLQKIASRLSNTLRDQSSSAKVTYPKASDLVARLAGDEFVILLNDVEGPWEATAVSDRVINILKTPFDIEHNQTFVSCSIGISIYPDDATNDNDLIQFSDIAMYHAKEQGKNHYQFYAQKLNDDLQKRLKINSRLRHSLNEGNFNLVYQPKININTGKITGLEALMRWNDDELGIISPADFIPIAEESGLITPLTEWLIRTTCLQIKEWQSLNNNCPPVSINVSSIQFKRRDLPEMITTAINQHNLNFNQIEIELTETSLLHNTSEAGDILNSLSDMGIRISLDDFGTGYSSLHYLNTLPIDSLKIDKSFITNIVSDDQEHAIIDAILAIAIALDLEVVAEGVETREQLNFLLRRHCDTVQGFYLSKPKPANEIAELLDHNFLENMM